MTTNDWWKNAIVYQIYPRSFQDSNGDGIGDIPGIISRLDYIRALGADVIWLSPIYASPGADNGYDISDYRAIHPDFGTMKDFDLLLGQVHQRGMKLVMDLVVNHTSDEHSWFLQAKQSKESAYHDFYIWRGGEENSPPNNWNSWFGGPAWEFNPTTQEYYLHIFHRKQPDLNWDNPNVRRHIYSMMSWWLNKGVDGFRMDVISLISKPSQFPGGAGKDLSPYCINGPHIHEYLQEMNREVLSHYPIMTVGECPGVTVDEAKKYAGFQRHELNMVFQFEHTGLTDGAFGKWTDKKPYLPDLKKVFYRWQSEMQGYAWNCLFWGNHDQPRAVSKFGCDWPEYRDISAKMLCACLYCMQGTPFIFQGEELGMTNPGFFSLEQYRDIESINAYRDMVGSSALDKRSMLRYLSHTSRDNARTPMQWSCSACAGFTTGNPWIGLGQNWRAVNAARELEDPNSVFHFYQQVLSFRKSNPIIRNGSFSLLLPDHEKIFAYVRELDGQQLRVFSNFSKDVVDIPAQMAKPEDEMVIHNYQNASTVQMKLRPYEVCVIRHSHV